MGLLGNDELKIRFACESNNIDILKQAIDKYGQQAVQTIIGLCGYTSVFKLLIDHKLIEVSHQTARWAHSYYHHKFMLILLSYGLDAQSILDGDVFILYQGTDHPKCYENLVIKFLILYGARASNESPMKAPIWAIPYEREVRDLRTACAEQMRALRWCMVRRGCPHDMALYFLQHYVAPRWLATQIKRVLH